MYMYVLKNQAPVPLIPSENNMHKILEKRCIMKNMEQLYILHSDFILKTNSSCRMQIRRELKGDCLSHVLT